MMKSDGWVFLDVRPPEEVEKVRLMFVTLPTVLAVPRASQPSGRQHSQQALNGSAVPVAAAGFARRLRQGARLRGG